MSLIRGVGLTSLFALTVPSAASGQPVPSTDFYTVTPCRLIDTRDVNGPYGGPSLLANTERAFAIVGRCGIPLSAAAISATLTVVSPTASGHLKLYASGTPRPNTSSINYGGGQTRANNAVVPLGGDGALAVYVSQASGTAHFVLDVHGYFGTSGCSAGQTPQSPLLGVDTGARTLTWPPVPGATSYNVYIKAVAGECGLLGPQTVTSSDQLIPNVSSPLDLSAFDQCGTCYFVDAVSVSGQCASPLQSDSGAPAPIGFSLLPCTP
jgi:hypothetical protein